MSKAIENFRQISKIPRPSKKEEKIREFLVDWAIIKNMDYVIDQA
jgi:dipeptidase D